MVLMIVQWIVFNVLETMFWETGLSPMFNKIQLLYVIIIIIHTHVSSKFMQFTNYFICFILVQIKQMLYSINILAYVMYY